MIKHLSIIVKERDLQEFIDKLDSKGWAVMEIEPRTCFNFIFKIVINYMVICEYVGPDDEIDLTPLDDND